MTRVNVVDPEELHRKHLLAEHREITRIPNCIVSGKLKPKYLSGPYRLGAGHVLFFTYRLKWLKERYKRVHAECMARGYDVVYRWPEHRFPDTLFNDYEVTEEDIELNINRLLERWPND